MEIKRSDFITNTINKVAEIHDTENQRRWDIIKKDNGYIVEYFEFFESSGKWEQYKDPTPETWSKEAIEFEFDIKL